MSYWQKPLCHTQVQPVKNYTNLALIVIIYIGEKKNYFKQATYIPILLLKTFKL